MENKLKILIATGIYPPQIGGPATYSKLLYDELTKRNIPVKVINFGDFLKFPKIIRHFIFFLKIIGQAWNMNIIFAQDTVSCGLPTLIASKLLNKRFFQRVPGDYAWEQGCGRYGVKDSVDDFQNKKYGWKIEFLRSIQRFVVNNAEGVIAPSKYFKGLVSGWMKEPQKVVSIYNGIDLSEIPPHSGDYEKNTIISAGRLVSWKGFETLIRILNILPNHKLFIAGEGPDLLRLKELAKTLNVESRVYFLGSLPRLELIKKIQYSEVFVLNSSFESFSFQLVEVMAAQTPIIVSDVGNIGEIAQDGVNSILVKVNDEVGTTEAIKKISSNLDLRNLLCKNAKNTANNFSIDYTINNLISLFNKR